MSASGYFDHNATTPLHPAAHSEWLEASARWWHNPSSLYREGAAARRKLEDAREQLGDLLQCEPGRIVFLSGATEANNALIRHVAALASTGKRGSGNAMPSTILAISAVEHPSLRDPATLVIGNERLQYLACHADGAVDETLARESWTNQRPALASVMAANNETGVLQPWRSLREHCQSQNILFHCDASQWLGKLPAADLGLCDFVTGSAHKFGGPPGSGFLVVPESGPAFRSNAGGGQENGRRAGTENVPGVCAMVAALAARIDGPEEPERMAEARDRFEDELLRRIPGAALVTPESSRRHRLWNTSMAILPGPRNVKWLSRLSQCGFQVSTGSACSRGAGASDVLRAMGLPDEMSGQVLRFSGGWDTTTEDWLALAAALEAVHADLAEDRIPATRSRAFQASKGH